METKLSYPNLQEPLDMLQNRLNDVSPEHRSLLLKWIEQLEKMEKQMRQLERIESFSHALTERDKSK